MQLDHLIQNTSFQRDTKTRIQPFTLDTLKEAFQLRKTASVNLPPSEKGIPTIAGKSKSELKDKERNTKNIRTKTGKKIENIRNTSIVIKIKVKIRIRKKRRIEAVIMILVLNPQRNTMRRKGSMREAKISATFRGTRKVSIRAQKWMKWAQ